MTPFILKGATKIPSETDTLSEHVYDRQLQVWIDSRSGVPVVVSSMGADASRYGETTVTETREGADQTEVASIHASRFGETTITKTMEGTDQGEVTTLAATRFGETTVTATQEGADRSEVTTTQFFDLDAPHSHF
jgi:hypothetical protein